MRKNFFRRMLDEEQELTLKCNKLSDFINGESFGNLSAEEQVDLREQFDHMLEYRNVLLRRIHRIQK